ncbi:MAG: hypothetical protein DCC50_04220 [Acidobacteria bacterium]|nr:MAG: hypothetical protein DCC50_04220 [Acidobacteriota bacterium]
MPMRDTQLPRVHPWALAQHGARVLDPGSDLRPAASDPWSKGLAPTAYRRSTLLVSGLPGGRAGETLQRLREIVERQGLPVALDVDPRDEEADKRAGELEGDLGELVDRVYRTRVLLTPATEGPSRPVDAWEVLLTARAELGADAGVDLEHLMIACPEGPGDGSDVAPAEEGTAGATQGAGGVIPLKVEPQGYWESHGGTGGGARVAPRTPVSLVIADPAPGGQQEARSPVVAVPDTGLGPHPWFEDTTRSLVTRTLAGFPLAVPPGPDPEAVGVEDDLVGLRAPMSGHGTFIAGIVRQTAPSARLLALPVVDLSGAAAEGDVHHALVALLVGHCLAQDAGSPDLSADGTVVDVLNLSLGFYHQSAEPLTAHPVLDLLRAFAERGVVVVTAMGNDATRRALYPAAWATGPDRPDQKQPPVVAVGALNPDGRSVATFSNSGPWVTAFREGVHVVSALPCLDASAQPAVALEADGRARSTVDPDDLRGGFGLWSGTSFAAPVLAGRLAGHLQAAGADDTTPGAMVERAWKGLEEELGWTT